MITGWTCGPLPGSEDEVLGIINTLFVSKTPHTPLGRGHDCAELANLDGKLALSTDMFWQDSHFRTSYFTPAEAGAKALAVAVSDLAAAGAVPMGFSLDLLLPPWIGMPALEEALAAMAAKARDYGIILVGGDVARGEQLGFSITVWGGPVQPGADFLQRGNAEPGQYIFLVGEAGLARSGLMELERSGRAALDEWPEACAAHLAPRPLLAEGQALSRLAHTLKSEGAQLASSPCPKLSLMDLSDGLARDLPRLLGAYGANLGLKPDMIPMEVQKQAAERTVPPEHLFLLGGEDYALLGTCPEALWPLLRSAVPMARVIGRVCEEKGLFLDGKAVELNGFDHFSCAKDGQHGQTLADPVLAKAAQHLVKMGREAWEAGLMAGFNGNISCRVTPQHPAGQGDVCLITRSGSAKSRLEPEDFAMLSLESGRHVGGSVASSEFGMHLGIYRACPDSRVIFHCHPPYLLALSLRLPAEERLLLPLPEAERYRLSLGFVPYFSPGSDELAKAVALAARDCEAVWMERHGLVVHGPDAASVLSLSEELEQLALVQLQVLGA